MTENQKGQALLEVIDLWRDSSMASGLFCCHARNIAGDSSLVADASLFLNAIIELHGFAPELIEPYRKNFTYWAADWEDGFDADRLWCPQEEKEFQEFRALVAKVQKLFADTLAD